MITLDDVTINYLQKWKQRQDEQKGMNFILSYNSVFTQNYTLRHIIRRYADVAKVHSIRIHALRHSHASLLISMGMNAYW